MKPLIFQFREQPMLEDTDLSMVIYSEKLNLNVNKITGEPAINALSASTVTGTKNYDEPSDTDKEAINFLMVTETRTFTRTEVADSDPHHYPLVDMMSTRTNTRQMIEGSDTD